MTATGGEETAPLVSWRELAVVCGRIAVQSFGGPAGQIAVMHRILVEEKRWLSERRFLHALSYCMLLPGPEATQLATYAGWLLRGTLGGLLAGLLFVLPGFVAILGLSFLYASYQQTDLLQAVFYGLKAAVLALVVEAVLRIGRRALGSRPRRLIAGAAFVALFFFAVPYPLVVLAAASVGLLLEVGRPGSLAPAGPEAGDGGTAAREASTVALSPAARESPSWRHAAGVLAVWLPVWFLPVVVVVATLGSGHVLVELGLFFSKVAVVTFGGAYSVLSYVADHAVRDRAWLAPAEMLDGLGMAETTPGPLIMVVQFIGYLAGWRNPGPLAPATAAVAASLMVTWVTFAPCFLWIFLGAPWVEALRGRRHLDAALAGITAAVVGGILNLALWLGLHTVFARVAEGHVGPLRILVPRLAQLDPVVLGLVVLAFYVLLRRRWGMLPTLGLTTGLGLVAFYG